MSLYWTPDSDSPSHIADSDLQRAVQDARASARSLVVAFVYCAVVIVLVALFARAWAIEDDLARARDAAFVAGMESR